MALLRLDNAELAYGDHALLNNVSFAIERGEKIALIGRNGAGKSSLMRILSGAEKLDSGVMNQDTSVKVNYLPQALPAADDTTVFDYIAAGLASLGKLLAEFEHLVHGDMDDKALERMQSLQDAIDTENGWDFQKKIHLSLQDLNLAPETPMKSLSGGWRKRVAIAKSLIADPDVLLMDEPTNHLDIPAIQWLQNLLSRSQASIVLISHDRRFLNEIASRILWLDRGNIMSFPGDYDAFLVGRDQFLATEEKQNALFDKRLAEEEKWIRQGIKARRTRNEGRVRALKAMRNERKARIDVKGNVNMQIDDSAKSGKLVVEMENVSYAYDKELIVRDVNLLVQRGDRIGVIGRNGAGKSTLIKLMLGELSTNNGLIRQGSKQQVAYFDQNREALDENMTVADTLAEGRDFIEVNGQNKHIMSYLSDFLFTPQRVRSPVSTLSGGERNRLLLAKLFSKQANILVLDEPTNDLDIETLELLEELIDAFKGTVIVISHDREFVDQIVTSTVFIADNAKVFNYVGGYQDLLRQHGELWPSRKDKEAQDAADEKTPVQVTQTSSAKVKKLSYKLQRELEKLPALIDRCEQNIRKLEEEMSATDFYQQDHAVVTQVTNKLADQQALLEAHFERWAELEG